MPLGMDVGLSPGDFVLDGEPVTPPRQGGGAPQIFGPCLLWPNGWMCQDVTWHGGRPRPTRRDIVFDVDPATPRKKGTPTPTQFLAHVYCGQVAGWMKTPLGAEVDLGAGHIVLDRVPAPAKGHSTPYLFGPCLLWPRSPISATAEHLFNWLRWQPKYRTKQTFHIIQHETQPDFDV